MTENSPAVSEEARLDPETERRLEEIRAALGVFVAHFIAIPDLPQNTAIEAEIRVTKGLAALRKRIRQLIEEARLDGARPFILGTNIPSIFPGKSDV